ncbi:hypothetical protein ACFWPU_39170 [Streptomyces sp. NPDC058471]|uniref:hypothetical protein n=1 Tax=Streptomyces sp. NPDC058471 TaxID=3346516 RepID=UPI0036593119
MAAGTAVAQAVGTDAWQNIRARVARLFDRGAGQDAAATVTLERLDHTAAELENTDPDADEAARSAAGAAWQTRFQDLLEELPEADRNQAAAQLRELVGDARQAHKTVSATGEGIAIVGGVHIAPSDHSVGAVKMGDVHLGNPHTPGPEQS